MRRGRLLSRCSLQWRRCYRLTSFIDNRGEAMVAVLLLEERRNRPSASEAVDLYRIRETPSVSLSSGLLMKGSDRDAPSSKPEATMTVRRGEKPASSIVSIALMMPIRLDLSSTAPRPHTNSPSSAQNKRIQK